MSANWRNDVTALCVLYLMLERGRVFEIKDEYANPIFRSMEKAGLIDDMGLEWAVSDVGKEALKRAVAAQDVLRQMEIFAHVDVTRQLTENEASPFANEKGQVRPEVWDPRFASENEGAFDMRLAVITWLGETVTTKPVSPHTIVFLQELGTGRFPMDTFWGSVRAYFEQAEAIVASAYKWQDAAPGDEPLAKARMADIYAAGQLEQRKRDGANCGGCGIPLVLFEQAAAERKELLTECPECARQFNAPEAGSLECPKCHSAIYEEEQRCGGCGATIDFSMPSGSVQTDVQEETVTTVWSSGYGYKSYGWLDPWDPFVDAMALSYLYEPMWVW